MDCDFKNSELKGRLMGSLTTFQHPAGIMIKNNNFTVFQASGSIYLPLLTSFQMSK